MVTDFKPNMDAVPADNLPDHVPAELVRDLNWAFGYVPVDYDEPYRETERFFKGGAPRIMYVPKAVRGQVSKGAWVVTHYDDITHVYQDAETFSTEGTVAYQWLAGEKWPAIPLGIDPPDHMKYRKLLNPFFSPKAVDNLDGKMRRNANLLLDTCINGREDCDFSYEFARIFPVQVFLDLMGFPQDQLEPFLDWENKVLHSMNIDIQLPALRGILAYLREFIGTVRRESPEGITTDIVNGMVDDRPITDDEIMGIMFFLWLGGLDTVAATIAMMFRRIALDHKMQQYLRENPAKIPDAVEEFLRTQPLVNSQRLVKRDTELAGMKVKKGDWVICLNTAGNFDPNEFDSPREVMLDRQPNRHFTLSGGPHRCLGSHLARRELRIALEEALPRLPMFSLKSDEDRRVHPGLMSVRNLNIAW
ncbi:cytochrome P450 [Sphingobium sp. SCG-1]|nr:cytochrome P450 [Sphingobium sp. SCG-1]